MHYTNTKLLTPKQVEHARLLSLQTRERGRLVQMMQGGHAWELIDKKGKARAIYANGVLLIERAQSAPGVIVLGTHTRFDFEPAGACGSDTRRKRIAAKFFFESMARPNSAAFYLECKDVPSDLSPQALPVTVGGHRIFWGSENSILAPNELDFRVQGPASPQEHHHSSNKLQNECTGFLSLESALNEIERQQSLALGHIERPYYERAKASERAQARACAPLANASSTKVRDAASSWVNNDIHQIRGCELRFSDRPR